MTFFLGFELEMTVDRVLVESDGPQLSAATDPAGQRWLVFRCRNDGEGSLWLCSPITDHALRQVETGRAAPRDAFRHSCTGLVEMVACGREGALPDRCLLCAEIPEALLPSPDLMVEAFGNRQVDVSVDRPLVRPIAPRRSPSTSGRDTRWSTSDEPISAGPLLCPAA
jgi:hypothetical protein